MTPPTRPPEGSDEQLRVDEWLHGGHFAAPTPPSTAPEGETVAQQRSRIRAEQAAADITPEKAAAAFTELIESAPPDFDAIRGRWTAARTLASTLTEDHKRVRQFRNIIEHGAADIDALLSALDEERRLRHVETARAESWAAALTAEQQAHRALRSWADGAKVDLDALQTELAAEQQAHERTLAHLNSTGMLAARLTEERDNARETLRLTDEQIGIMLAATEATLEARNREVGELREALDDIYRNDPPHASAIAARALKRGVWTSPPSTTPERTDYA